MDAEIAKRVERFIATAEEYAARDKPQPTWSNLNRLSKFLPDEFAALRDAVDALAATYE
jgi:hypothetical protein